MSSGKTVTAYGWAARTIEQLAQDYPTHTEHRVGLAALRIGLKAILGEHDLLDKELVVMAKDHGQSTREVQ